MIDYEFEAPMTEPEPTMSVEQMLELAQVALHEPVQNKLAGVDDEYYKMYLPSLVVAH